MGRQLSVTALADQPRRGDVWLTALGAGRGGEPGKTRPAVVVSADALVTGEPDDLIVIVPVFSPRAPSPLRVELGETAGLDRPIRAVCGSVRSVVASRLIRKVGSVNATEMAQIATTLGLILEVDQPARPS